MDESEEGNTLPRANSCNGLGRRYHSVCRLIRINTDCSMARSREVLFLILAPPEIPVAENTVSRAESGFGFGIRFEKKKLPFLEDPR
jgi:hypothetical protein